MGGSGKTTALVGSDEHGLTPGIIPALAQRRRVFVLDLLGNIDCGGMHFDGAEQLRLFLKAEVKGLEQNPSGIYRLKAASSTDRADFLRVLSLGGDSRKGAVPGWLVVDEAKQILGTHRVNEDAMWSLDFGRNFNQSILAVGRRPNILNRNLRQNSTFCITFAQNDAGEFPDGLAGDASKVEQLGQHEVTHLGTLPQNLDAVTSWTNYRSVQ